MLFTVSIVSILVRGPFATLYTLELVPCEFLPVFITEIPSNRIIKWAFKVYVGGSCGAFLTGDVGGVMVFNTLFTIHLILYQE